MGRPQRSRGAGRLSNIVRLVSVACQDSEAIIHFNHVFVYVKLPLTLKVSGGLVKESKQLNILNGFG